MKNIKSISFPNTCQDNECTFFIVGRSCDEIKQIWKNGEMALIAWFQIIKDKKVIAEIKESVCNIYGEDEMPPVCGIEF